MQERADSKQVPSQAIDLKQEFRTHLQSVEFGSPDYAAFCDFFALESQRHNRNIEIDALRLYEEPRDRQITESELRITETRIAIIESEIE